MCTIKFLWWTRHDDLLHPCFFFLLWIFCASKMNANSLLTHRKKQWKFYDITTTMASLVHTRYIDHLGESMCGYSPCLTKRVRVAYPVAVSRGYDTCFSGKACDGLCQLLKSTESGWNTIRVSTDRVDLCQTHFKQVPDFSRAPRSGQITRAGFSQQANTRSFSPVPAFGSTWVVLWLLFFRSAPSTFPHKRFTHLGQFPGVPCH